MHEQGFEIIPTWRFPSTWDTASVKYTYGWPGSVSYGDGLASAIECVQVAVDHHAIEFDVFVAVA